MPEVIFPGADGRLEGRFRQGADKNAPIAIILHPLPQLGGTMNDMITHQLYQQFVQRDFSVLRYNSRGVGRSQGAFDNGVGELSDAAAALDWLQALNPEVRQCWVAGYSFGAWIAMQLLMRRPEIDGFISIAPPANLYDFNFLAPCPASGLIVHGAEDRIVPRENIEELVARLKAQRGITTTYESISRANHFFENEYDILDQIIHAYLGKRIAEIDTERK